ncbi:MAG: acetyl-CoA carboxylase biotin carboxylase subunit [Deltaproteobacteria bacterium]|nr:acetyl-CoA carboxylase biotin carboxylase subunit [Deltaproteobacteria bacterium]
MFNKVLIANRGEVALRVIRACRELGVRTVAVHSEADVGALHVRFADEAVCIGPADARKSYLHVPAIIAAAEITNADALHPGYGFLSENAEFAEICRKCRLTFIGPSPETMRTWGSKVRAREKATSMGLPVLPGSGVLRDVEHALAEASRVGYPVLLKASGGGGGRGMKVTRNAEDMRRAFVPAQQEALAAFKNSDIFLERYVERPKHIEFQVLGDGKGHAMVLGERECSVQRRHQKLVEESPSPAPALTVEAREDMSRTIERVMREGGYASLGTLEFIMDERGHLYFMEMNTRLQVEHPVTEMVTGVDLVCEQIRVAAGEDPSIPWERQLVPRGAAIECRINAEDPESFAPWPGTIREYHPPGGHGIRVDSGVFGGWTVPAHYDSLIVKLVAHGATREQAISRMQRALDETIVTGIRTNVELHKRILADEEFRRGTYTTRLLERMLAPPPSGPPYASA